MCIDVSLLIHSQSVWQAPELSLGQKRVSTFFLPSWSCWGLGSSARQMYLYLCSCRDPSWLTFTGIQGVQGVLRRTSGQASRLHTLYSWGQNGPNEFLLKCVQYVMKGCSFTWFSGRTQRNQLQLWHQFKCAHTVVFTEMKNPCN